MADHVFNKIATYRSPAELRARLQQLEIDLPCDDEIHTADQGSVLQASQKIGSFSVGNRWCIHPMEGWDAHGDGTPSEKTLRRWRHFGESGAKLIWGGEAAAVEPAGRANPNQTMATAEHEAGLQQLLSELTTAHQQKFGTTEDLLVGLQLTHSGRFCRPNDHQPEPRIAYHHPLLDSKYGIDPDDDSVVWTDDELDGLVDRYVIAAQTAQRAGFRFVDVKCCHGYLLHEFLSARVRSGPYGGDYQGRTRLLKTIIGRIQRACPDLLILVRLSFFDTVPFQPGPEAGVPVNYKSCLPYDSGFGCDREDPLQLDLTEPIQLATELQQMGVAALNLSCGSPYYNPHLQRPAAFPPSDGYPPPHDPLLDVARQIHAVRDCRSAVPGIPLVGTGYSYLQDYLPHIAQAVVRAGWVDFVGLGRMVLSYWNLPADSLRDGVLQRKQICRTFSDCTTAPRNSLASGCYPLDPYYKQQPEAGTLRERKKK
ncbi:MAG: NADH:flavin oxidoreductase [Planctomycetota bacterium]|nr:NADH:flavin oxidoreductase [Planctomycetota bacterium]